MSIADRHVDAPTKNIYKARTPSQIRGFVVHMAEGNNVAAYLSHDPARGVSVQYTVEADGEIVSMVPESRTAGSMNPLVTRHDTIGYYGWDHLHYVLGDLAENPNVGSIAIEVAGKHVDGPSEKQIVSLVRLFEDCRTRYPRLKPLGHRDQQNVKPCPGTTAAIRDMFARMGGHGMDYQKEPKNVASIDFVPDRICDVLVGSTLFTTPGSGSIGVTTDPVTRPHLGLSPDRKYVLTSASIDGKDMTAWVIKSAVSKVRAEPPAPTDPLALEQAAAAGRKSGIKASQDALAVLV